MTLNIMLEKNKLISIIALLICCVNCHNKNDKMVLQSHIRQYLDIYLNDNKKINSESNVIIIKCVTIDDNEFNLDIMSDMPENLHYSFWRATDSIYLYTYKAFRIYILDNNHKLLKGSFNNIESLKEPSDSNVIPISYDGPFWNIKIKKGTIVDFTYQFCKPDTLVLKKLKSIPIPTSWGGA